ncbi:bifunctional lysylphosphatidylglycerol flippase/synthetase MprF [Desulfuromonas carbonis]|uniref:bifunctional lysylphosphatidylglycerol flippase/synthetase MprF n=1 Tax=Desulfuromonas sp. DDH964 TaxID=1823759 RepID=UPI00078EE179|nr:bifunctional lysylphosphatidylglycerol flippase/synthetase MprF [Desulfuromonas sp. DDH964]AMV71209.1 Phosphatidylglycerol lysyltransferase [Desulfuromonas sp. DDH964]
MSPVHQKSALAHRLLPLLALILFAVALWVLHDVLRQIHYQHVLVQLRAIPGRRIFAALGLTVLSYLVMTGYDRLALRYVRHPLPPGKVTLAAFVSYAFSNTIGLSLLTSGSIRYRLYSAWELSAEEIARLVAFTTLTFWLGIITVAGGIFVALPVALPLTEKLPFASSWPLGLLFIALVAGYLATVAWRKEPFRFRSWELPLPSLRLAAGQLLVGSLDWLLAGSVLFVLLPAASPLSFWQFLGIFLLAQVVALISHVPGGLGVFESMILLSAPGIPPATLLGAMLVYRGIYYLLPLALATLLLAGNELLQRRRLIGQAVLLAGRWGSALMPQLLAAATLVSGAVLLFSGATPALPGRLHWLKEMVPLPVIELSHFFGSLVGVCLLLLARGLQRRLDAAYLLAAVLLGVGSLLSLLKGGDYEEALLLGLMLAALLPCRRHFYRKASLFSEPFSVGWGVTVLLILASSVWLGIFAYKHVAYRQELWWHFALLGDAPRFLRAAVGASTLLLVLAVTRLLRPASRDPDRPGPAEIARAREVIRQAPETLANLALLGDKALLFHEAAPGFVMYGVEGSSWVALGDPIGAPDGAAELAWEFRELVERHGGEPVFYEVGTAMLPVYLDMGLTLLKLGEVARVPLVDFSLEGSASKGLRYTYRRLTREGCEFEVVPATGVPTLLPELRQISDAWLAAKKTREKGFSLGRFDEDYLLNFPVAVVRRQGAVIAFANLWPGADHQELSIDLMRFASAAPSGVMEYLFICLLLWGQEAGYQHFDLGMAPLSGMENRPFAPLWNRLGAVIFQHGEHFYNFEGLREYKEKFNPVWEPRYLACPGGLALPKIFLNVAALISGGLKGVVSK